MNNYSECSGGRDIVAMHAPGAISRIMRRQLPVIVQVGEETLSFEENGSGQLENRIDDLVTVIEYEYEEKYNSLRWNVKFINKGNNNIDNINIIPLKLNFAVDPENDGMPPRVRYMTGGFHYDGTYPPRAYQVFERAFMTHDHCKPLKLSGDVRTSHDYVPMMQFAYGSEGNMAGFMVSLEWSSDWSIEASWENPNNYIGEPVCDFIVQGEISALENLSVKQGHTVETPNVHMVFFEGDSWTVLDNAQKAYISERIAARTDNKPHVNKVTYDHWFGIHGDFDFRELKKQADRAAFLGCEYFCMDGGWYGKGAFGASGKGRWDEPDPEKFPNGSDDVKKLSNYVRSLGMGFGIWQQMADSNGSGELIPFDTGKGREKALKVFRKWIKEWNLTWMRWEMEGDGGFEYINGYYEILKTLRQEFPNLQIECCWGGGKRFDLGMIRYCTSTWLSDHTANPEVCRFMQTGALRFWPSYLLNMAVRAHRGKGDKEAFEHNLLSRMPGTLSFNGDIAQWSEEAVIRMSEMVRVYKKIRHLQLQPAFFPLSQPQSINDWDVVVFGDGNGENQIMYAFRIKGSEEAFVKIPEAKGSWKQLLGAREAEIASRDDGFILSLPENNSALWIR